jgi:aquaporin Z
MVRALRLHWPEYLMEAAALGLFMVSACAFGALLWHPGSPLSTLVADGVGRRALMGLAMGATAVGLIYSPWGQQSGAHMNPAVTLAFLRLGKVKPWDAVFYVLAQLTGGLLGVLLSRLFLGEALIHPSVNYVITVPGDGGAGVAFVAEVGIAFLMMATVLIVSNGPLARATGLFAGALVAAYITLEAPLSGMSLNPARTLGSALPAMDFSALWVYMIAPPLGMLLAAETYTSVRSVRAVHCAKLHHQNDKRCIFCPDELVPGQA